MLGTLVPALDSGAAGALPQHEHHTLAGFVPRHSHTSGTQAAEAQPSCADEGNADGLVCTPADDVSTGASALLAGAGPAAEPAAATNLDASLPAAGWQYAAPEATLQTPPPRS
jgi:hypothetical protein